MKTVRLIAPLIFGFSLWCASSVTFPGGGVAQTRQATPSELQKLVTQVDQVASQQNLQDLMQFYAPNFSSGDGLNRAAMADALTQFWKTYPQLNYRTQIQSWKKEGAAFVVETLTQVTGSKQVGGREIQLTSTMRSRQRWENQKIVKQDILSERTTLTSGKNPPNVDFKLPEQVKMGQRYTLDAIVAEPLGDDLLLGAVTETPIKASNYTNPESLELELLSSGGLFKQAVAPTTADPRWISAVLVRGDGLTIITQRLRIVK